MTSDQEGINKSQVSDLTWLGKKAYNSETGAGAIGVEFAGTAVSSTGSRKTIASSTSFARRRIQQNKQLQWQENYYRGYFMLSVQKDKVTAQFFGGLSHFYN